MRAQPLTSSGFPKLSQIAVGTTLDVWCDFDLYTELGLNFDTVLLEAPFDPIRRNMNSVLLTIDLTKAVVDEAIERNDSIIVAYRGFITPYI